MTTHKIADAKRRGRPRKDVHAPTTQPAHRPTPEHIKLLQDTLRSWGQPVKGTV